MQGAFHDNGWWCDGVNFDNEKYIPITIYIVNGSTDKRPSNAIQQIIYKENNKKIKLKESDKKLKKP